MAPQYGISRPSGIKTKHTITVSEINCTNQAKEFEEPRAGIVYVYTKSQPLDNTISHMHRSHFLTAQIARLGLFAFGVISIGSFSSALYVSISIEIISGSSKSVRGFSAITKDGVVHHKLSISQMSVCLTRMLCLVLGDSVSEIYSLPSLQLVLLDCQKLYTNKRGVSIIPRHGHNNATDLFTCLYTCTQS